MLPMLHKRYRLWIYSIYGNLKTLVDLLVKINIRSGRDYLARAEVILGVRGLSTYQN